jgi:HEAT repeat protein
MPGQSQFERQFGDLTSDPEQPWAQSDPADSVYRLARQTLNRGEYRRASQLFGDITKRFPNSAYAADARYWKAFALYRIGGPNDLREALSALDGNGRRYHQSSLQADAATLALRIRGALAQQGDARAITTVERTAGQQGEPCDQEDAAVRVQALSSLGEMDRESTTPILRRILAKRDDCSRTLRRNALFLLAKRGDSDATSLIINSARNDPDIHIRSDALRWLARMPGDQALATLEEIARTPGNEDLQRAAIGALAKSESPRARQGIRNIIERGDVSEALRAKALASIDDDNTADGGAYVRAIYPRLETTRLKLAAIRAIARIGGKDNEQWLLALVRNQNEPLDVRSTALTYVGRTGISIGNLVSMYDAAGDRPLRVRLINLYANRSEPEASDKLISIAKNGTDPEMRRLAISRLARKNDPRTKKLLLEILDK